MRTLFAISMLCFFSLFAAVLALLRKVYQSQYLLERRPTTRFGSSGVRGDHGYGSSTPAPIEHSITGRAVRPELMLRPAPQQSVQDLAPAKSPDWRFMVHGADPDHRDETATINPGRRHQPQPTHFGRHERLDWTYFNKDLGDLSDPYEPPRFTGTSNAQPGTSKQPL